ncbi:hypothetical protein TEA_002758 [Camellia sinensis var. sinensis]|uniref:Chaperone DnaJ C-terminal domain-containing protein n=1 Tax=Camellia sinensis var. sinensis TaxID=542762 RepID=A0A4S4EF25_CAMSN|nr:hypothetical protein TEA_002758 [Camellia sinensis var. sinensis]
MDVLHMGCRLLVILIKMLESVIASGEVISDRDRCPQCKGNKVKAEKKVLEVHVEKGMQHAQKISFRGEADEAPDTIPGDIVFVLHQKEHPKFKRKFDDLYVEHSLSLTEALCGQSKAINDEGMPHHQRPFMKGRLFIHFNVDFPESGFLSPDKCRDLEAILPPRPSKQSLDMEMDECEETTLHDVNMEEEMRRKEQHRLHEAYDDEDNDDNDEPTMHRMACNQQ